MRLTNTSRQVCCPVAAAVGVMVAAITTMQCYTFVLTDQELFSCPQRFN